ncbi:ParB/RepB/Spo0J family partition protein [Arsenicicoccus sp. oral taxon 190]|uniref:ParB/RepB/Spo0J family partition protein n=1 Tax=Arsenicicoccus sp. oral taxon 190 TaxID=1658671 RepID=UPI00067A07A5|nr:ParB/RepB/Spo0J family partition protein [Arsenicicoccus sp. oral taxon 190]AKT50858.1 chromosome partitioning protein ParB [Arsenicicoccus sp. oral taxon 190]
MSEKRRGLGRGLGALIPQAPAGDRPVDVFFPDAERLAPGTDADVSRESTPRGAADAVMAPDDLRGLGLGRRPLDPSLIASVTSEAATRGEGGLTAVPGAAYAEVPVGSIQPNAKQPRQVFDEDDMSELVHSVREIGVLQPIVVRPLREAAHPDHPDAEYELIMGERRWRATQAAGLATVPAIVRQTDDDEMLRHALLENLHRAQLNPLEEAAAYQQLLEDFGCTHDELASKLGRSRPQISNTIRLLRLPPLVARRVAAGVLSAGHARALLGLDDAAAMERLAQRIVAEGLSVRSVEEIVALGGDGSSEPKQRAPRSSEPRPELDDLASSLADQLETRVQVSMGKRKGRLTVEFASMEDLHRILALMGHEGPDGHDTHDA